MFARGERKKKLLNSRFIPQVDCAIMKEAVDLNEGRMTMHRSFTGGRHAKRRTGDRG